MICRNCGYEHIAKSVNPDNIIQIVLDYFGVQEQDLFSRNKTAQVANVRQIIGYMLRRYTKLSFLEIGAKLNRHHSSIMNSMRVVNNYRETEELYNYNIMQIINQIDATFLQNQLFTLQDELNGMVLK